MHITQATLRFEPLDDATVCTWTRVESRLPPAPVPQGFEPFAVNGWSFFTRDNYDYAAWPLAYAMGLPVVDAQRRAVGILTWMFDLHLGAGVNVDLGLAALGLRAVTPYRKADDPRDPRIIVAPPRWRDANPMQVAERLRTDPRVESVAVHLHASPSLTLSVSSLAL